MALDIEKALTTAAGSGAVLIPEKLDPELAEIAVKETPLLKIFKEIDWETNTYQWNERTALAGASAYDENDTFASAESTYTRKSVDIKMVKSDGAVSNLLYESTKAYIDALQSEIEGATQSCSQEVERLYIEGNATANPKEYDGLSNLVTQTIDAACNPISLDILDEAINTVQNNGGKASIIVLANRDLQEMHRIMRDKMVYNWEKVEVAAGVYLTHYRGIPLYGTAFIPTTLGVSGQESYGFVLDLTKIVVPVKKNFTYEDLSAKVTTDSRAFRIKTWRALAVKAASKFHAKIINIAKPS